MSVLWRWQSDDGTKWNDFDETLCSCLENALQSGRYQFQIPERNWLFDLSAMTQTNVKSLSSRKVRRIQAAEPTVPHQATIPVPAVMGCSSLQQSPNVLATTSLLPAGWIQQIDAKTGYPYYVNTATGQSSWDRPVASCSSLPLAPPLATPLPDGWIQHIDPATGSPYYVNIATGQSCWHAPAKPAGSTLASSSLSHTPSHVLAALHSEPASGQAAFSLLEVEPALSALSFHESGMPSVSSSIPKSGAVWKWESDDGTMFNDFEPDVSASLEKAIASGQLTFEIPERFWIFDLASMTQSNHRTQSKRRIRRLSVATTTNSVTSAASLHSNAANALCASGAQLDQTSQSVNFPALSAAQQMWVSSVASQSQGATLDFGAAIGQLVAAAKGIPIDIVYGVYVRKGHDVELARQLLVQMNQLRDKCADKFSYSDIEAAMVATSDSYQAALEMLLQQLPEEVPKSSDAAATEAAPALDPDEKANCVICWANPSTHAFIPCGHKHICSNCSDDKAIVDGLKGKCPTCSASFSMILHIYEG